ncbi:hypothetical protein EDEG_01663 [Edhazardia aedis USNM 41457]|uniref:Uncharacterized protein n=1 Tax=Edhazardia aedis (strain USNM 41457) TaxID=1003232 RepID=J9D953_EDHAE|nr:hypothetical protein EDEG_01663 [Edhazardia aedis USNM 41457]|eukprot:EJW04029.1 hypothetical protein EDEG_01663 [Edhazardia aedis USNM 41457]
MKWCHCLNLYIIKNQCITKSKMKFFFKNIKHANNSFLKNGCIVILLIFLSLGHFLIYRKIIEKSNIRLSKRSFANFVDGRQTKNSKTSINGTKIKENNSGAKIFEKKNLMSKKDIAINTYPLQPQSSALQCKYNPDKLIAQNSSENKGNLPIKDPSSILNSGVSEHHNKNDAMKCETKILKENLDESTSNLMKESDVDIESKSKSALSNVNINQKKANINFFTSSSDNDYKSRNLNQNVQIAHHKNLIKPDVIPDRKLRISKKSVVIKKVKADSTNSNIFKKMKNLGNNKTQLFGLSLNKISTKSGVFKNQSRSNPVVKSKISNNSKNNTEITKSFNVNGSFGRIIRKKDKIREDGKFNGTDAYVKQKSSVNANNNSIFSGSEAEKKLNISNKVVTYEDIHPIVNENKFLCLKNSNNEKLLSNINYNNFKMVERTKYYQFNRHFSENILKFIDNFFKRLNFNTNNDYNLNQENVISESIEDSDNKNNRKYENSFYERNYHNQTECKIRDDHKICRVDVDYKLRFPNQSSLETINFFENILNGTKKNGKLKISLLFNMGRKILNTPKKTENSFEYQLTIDIRKINNLTKDKYMKIIDSCQENEKETCNIHNKSKTVLIRICVDRYFNIQDIKFFTNNNNNKKFDQIKVFTFLHVQKPNIYEDIKNDFKTFPSSSDKNIFEDTKVVGNQMKAHEQGDKYLNKKYNVQDNIFDRLDDYITFYLFFKVDQKQILNCFCENFDYNGFINEDFLINILQKEKNSTQMKNKNDKCRITNNTIVVSQAIAKFNHIYAFFYRNIVKVCDLYVLEFIQKTWLNNLLIVLLKKHIKMNKMRPLNRKKYCNNDNNEYINEMISLDNNEISTKNEDFCGNSSTVEIFTKQEENIKINSDISFLFINENISITKFMQYICQYFPVSYCFIDIYEDLTGIFEDNDDIYKTEKCKLKWNDGNHTEKKIQDEKRDDIVHFNAFLVSFTSKYAAFKNIIDSVISKIGTIENSSNNMLCYLENNKFKDIQAFIATKFNEIQDSLEFLSNELLQVKNNFLEYEAQLFQKVVSITMSFFKKLGNNCESFINRNQVISM